MDLAQDDLEAIVVAVLAVNSFSLEQAHRLLPAFRLAGLLQPRKVADMDLGNLIVALGTAGFQRGGLMGLMANRYQSVMKEIARGKLDDLSDLLKSGNTEAATNLLLQVKGVGPSVAANAIMLIKSSRPLAARSAQN